MLAAAQTKGSKPDGERLDGTGALDKAIDMLELLGEQGPLTASEVSDSLGIPLPTVYRVLRAWQRRGYLALDESKRYAIGSMLLRLSSSLSSIDLLRKNSAPILEALVTAADVASAQIAVLDAERAIFIAQATRPQGSFRLDLNVGSVIPLHSTALGKALIAVHGGDEAEALIGRLDLAPLTEATIVDAAQLLQQCLDGQRVGHWASIGEHAQDLWSVAIPLEGTWDGTRVALGVSDHMWSFSRERIPVVASELHKAGESLARLRRDVQPSPERRGK